MTFESIPQELFDTYNEAVDMMNSSGGFAIQCRLVYPPKNLECPNCVINPMTGKSSNVYKSGGTIPFSAGICPFCNGNGLYSTEVSENIYMRYYANSDTSNNVRQGDFKVFSGGIAIAVGDALTYGQLSDMPKLKRCIYCIMPLNKTGFETFKYQLLAEPALHGFKKSSIKAVWKRIE